VDEPDRRLARGVGDDVELDRLCLLGHARSVAGASAADRPAPDTGGARGLTGFVTEPRQTRAPFAGRLTAMAGGRVGTRSITRVNLNTRHPQAEHEHS
jgi:hypothetical protein